jgi:hypothetical protein
MEDGPLIQLKDTQMFVRVDDVNRQVGCFAMFDLTVNVALNQVMPFPECYVNAAGDMVRYEPDEAIVWGIQMIPELTVMPNYAFPGVDGTPGPGDTWHPAALVVSLDHPEDVNMTGTTGSTCLRDYGRGKQSVSPACAFTRRVLQNGQVLTLAPSTNNGFQVSDLSCSIRNLVEGDNDPATQ